jgi:hypothetical protein
MTSLDKLNIITTSSLLTLIVITAIPEYGTFVFAASTTSPEESEQDRTITSDGCAEGWSYYVDNPNPIYEPIDKIGKGPPPNKGFCAALGCPYNPPNLP